MSWNYRVVHSYGFANGRAWDSLKVHEVYYDGDVPKSMTLREVSPAGETMDELKSSWQLYQTAFEKPVLFFDCNQQHFTDVNAWEVHCAQHPDVQA